MLSWDSFRHATRSAAVRHCSMRVFTYFDASPNLPDQGRLIRLWATSWANRGWEPRILHPRIAARHPRYLEARRAKCGPRVLRWLALEKMGGGYLVDYDLINFGFAPHRCADSLVWAGLSAPIAWATRAGARAAVARLLAGGFLASPIGFGTSEFGSSDWHEANLVHFSTAACGGVPKHKAILACGRPL